MFKTEVSSEDIQKARQTAKRSRTSVACSRCKTGKMKCSDYRPCKQCTNSKIACVEVREKTSSGADTVEKSLAWRRSERASKIYHLVHQPSQPVGAAKLLAGQRQDLNQKETLGSPSHSVSKSLNTSDYLRREKSISEVGANPSYEFGTNPSFAMNVIPWSSTHRNPLQLSLNVMPPSPQLVIAHATICPSSSSFNGSLQPPVPAFSAVLNHSPTSFHGLSLASPAILPPLATILRNSNLTDPMPALPTLQPGALRLLLAVNALNGASQHVAALPTGWV